MLENVIEMDVRRPGVTECLQTLKNLYDVWRKGRRRELQESEVTGRSEDGRSPGANHGPGGMLGGRRAGSQ